MAGDPRRSLRRAAHIARCERTAGCFSLASSRVRVVDRESSSRNRVRHGMPRSARPRLLSGSRGDRRRALGRRHRVRHRSVRRRSQPAWLRRHRGRPGSADARHRPHAARHRCSGVDPRRRVRRAERGGGSRRDDGTRRAVLHRRQCLGAASGRSAPDTHARRTADVRDPQPCGSTGHSCGRASARRRRIPIPTAARSPRGSRCTRCRGPASPTRQFIAATPCCPMAPMLTCAETLRFRSADEIFASLETAHFDVERTWGDWDNSPLTPTSCELIVLARRRTV